MKHLLYHMPSKHGLVFRSQTTFFFYIFLNIKEKKWSGYVRPSMVSVGACKETVARMWNSFRRDYDYEVLLWLKVYSLVAECFNRVFTCY